MNMEKKLRVGILGATGMVGQRFITLLANQSILIHNLKDKEHPKEPLTEDVVELLTTPLDLAGYKTAITEALYKGTKRNVESEKDSKNAPVG